MADALIQSPPRTIVEVWEGLPEGTLCQVINNTLIMSPAPLDNHQKLLGKIFARIYMTVEQNDLGEVRVSPYDVHFDEENILQPDIVFVSKENSHKIKERGLFGAPDLVIEILSPSNKKYDTRDKKEIYERFGVKEYFIVDPSEKVVNSYVLIEDEFAEVSSATGIITSKLLNLTINF